MEKGNFMLNSILFGDCLEKLKIIPIDYVDVILTDPPYNASNININLPNNKTGGAFYKINENWDKFNTYYDYL
ncbi:MAG: hypothetical protein LBC92_05650 [Rickettsiales bacterium]|jgi:site-specific DNA-methyltransferase (adenine-specific)/modification methylase|nr:hypothetical protein [Rickettsiales bacterium]